MYITSTKPLTILSPSGTDLTLGPSEPNLFQIAENLTFAVLVIQNSKFGEIGM